MQAAESVPQIKRVFGMMTNLWKLFYYSPKRAEKLKEVQAILHLPELKVVKPSSTRWLSHERCLKAIHKELPAIITTLQQVFEAEGDAEAHSILCSIQGIATIILLGKILNVLATLNCFMQRKSADFARFHIILSSIQEELKSCKLSSAVWCDAVTATVTILETEHGIVVTAPTGMTRRSTTSTESVSDIGQLQRSVAIPYIELLLENIQNRFLIK